MPIAAPFKRDSSTATIFGDPLEAMRPKAVDLFAGAGGLSLGFEQAGFDIVAAVEIDPIHCAVHEYNFPNCATICRDISGLSGDEIRQLAKLGNREIDAVIGGAPCQGFSLIGHRALDDPRNSLVAHFARIVFELRPRYFVFENVRGLTIGSHRRFLDEVMDEFEANGYRVERNFQVLNAAEYGVPQDRRRLFLFGAREHLELPRYPKAITSVPRRRRDLPNVRPDVPTVADALGDLPKLEGRNELFVTDSLRATMGTASDYAKELRGAVRAANDFSYQRLYEAAMLTGCLRTKHTPLSISRFRGTKPGKVERISRFLKLDANGICNTLRAGSNSDRGAFTSPRPIHYREPRCISNREAARLHSFPDWFRLHITKWHGFRQIGNSVPPMLGRAVGSAVIAAMGVRASVPKGVIRLGSPDLLKFDASAAACRYGVPPDINGRRLRKSSVEMG